MSDEEKIANPSHTTIGGYLKVLDYKEAFQDSYSKASNEDKALLLKLPNFDADVFLKISGIDVRECPKKAELKDNIARMEAELADMKSKLDQ